MIANRFIKSLGQALLLLTVSFSAVAVTLTPEQALQRVETSGPVFRIPGNNRFKLEYTEKSDGENILYVFNKGNEGFIIASADDDMPPLLGYSDRGGFDFEKLSPEFKWWLSQYAAEAGSIETADKSPAAVGSSTRADKESIPPLLSTEWNQGAPFNFKCPYYGNMQCVTGCVATAMAQILKYHGYPSKGTGSNSYTWRGQTLSYDYSEAEFDYSEMLDMYDSNYTQAQEEAVANLMYACGVSVNMDYSYQESGASSMSIMKALKNYFNYDSDMRFLLRDNYSGIEWNDIVYGELKQRRPVLYSGTSEAGGHMFICDGYDEGYFHINWGWGGYSDGWFLLSALNPEGQGIGGSGSGYNYGQSIICGVQPDTGVSPASYPIYATSGFDVPNVYRNLFAEISFLNNGGVYNYSPNEINTLFYLKAVSAAGEQRLSEGVGLNFQGSEASCWGFLSLVIPLPAVGEGDYKVYVVFDGPDGKLQQLSVPYVYNDYLNMKVDADGNKSFFREAAEGSGIVVTRLAPVSAAVSAEPADFDITILNNGDEDYSGPLSIRCFVSDADQMISEETVDIAVEVGETLTETVTLTFDVPAGDYLLQCYDVDGEPCSEMFPLQIKDDADIPKIRVTQLAPVSEVVSGVETDFDISFENIGNVEYSGSFYIATYRAGSEDLVDEMQILIPTLQPGDVMSGWVTLSFDLPDGNYDMRCFDMFGKLCSDVFPLVIGKETVYATSISLDAVSIDAEVGTTVRLVATVLPEDATDKTVAWSSSDESVAVVDQDGNVTVMAVGEAEITARTTDGSDLHAECIVNAVSSVSALFEETGKADVYSFGGVLLRKDAEPGFIDSLEKGAYIIRTPRKVIRILKR